jgi:hypothetical protein
MSTAQRNDACLISVGPEQADVLRHQTLVVLEANHYYFEDLLDFGPEAQFALSVIYRDAFAVLDAIGWAPDPDAGTVEVPISTGHLEQLRHRHYDLAHANIDRLPAPDQPVSAQTRKDLDVTRTAIAHLNAIIANAGRSELH